MNSRSTPEHRFRDRGAAGFTLVEVMIAILLLSMISIAIYQATTQTFRYRARIINEGDFYGGVRLAMGLMDRDVAALFSPVTMNPKVTGRPGSEPPADIPGYGAAFGVPPGPNAGPRGAGGANAAQAAADQQKLEELGRSELGQTSDYWLPATDLTAIRPSRFVGTENRIQFVAASHQRVYKNSPESDFAKIYYELRDDRDAAVEGTRILVRAEDPNVFDDSGKREKTVKLYPLLPGVAAMKFRYFRVDKRAWETTWDSGREDMKGLYPDLIELKIEVKGMNRLAFTGTYYFKPETPFYGLDTAF